MKIFPLTIYFLISIIYFGFCQDAEYNSYKNKADNFFNNKDYKNAVVEYSNAFETIGWKGYAEDRYKAARAWTLLGVFDSAFYNLNRIAEKTDYLEFHLLSTEEDFKILHDDKRWKNLMHSVNPNNEVYNDSLAQLLIKMHDDDQKYRRSLENVRNKYGWESKEFNDLLSSMSIQDSINLKIVTDILDKYGWLSKNEISKTGNSALWLVIQHADLPVQEKYFPMMQKAVENKKASRVDLAYLEDRILMRNGKKQLYGTQYKIDTITHQTKLWDVENPINLNKRREAIGLPPM